MGTVSPPEVADTIRRRLERVHITGPLRTLTQDIAFAPMTLARCPSCG
jgi:hypothetical protein